PAADHLERFAHGVGGRCARGRDGGVVALRAVAHRNLRRRHVREHLHHVEGVDAVAAFIDDVLHRFVGIRIATHAVAEHHADAIPRRYSRTAATNAREPNATIAPRSPACAAAASYASATFVQTDTGTSCSRNVLATRSVEAARGFGQLGTKISSAIDAIASAI